MALFQNSVLAKYQKSIDKQKLQIAYTEFKSFFHDPIRQDNIRESTEEQFQEGFLTELFGKILGYTLNPNPNYNLKPEYKNEKNSKKADGAILINQVVKAVIELKGTDTTDLGKVETQAFGYKNNQAECVYVITSNYEKLRFYTDNAIEHIEFNLFTLTEAEFELLYTCLSYESISQNIPKKLKKDSLSEENKVTKQLYNDYSLFKKELHQNLVKLNPQFEPLELFKKSQKLLDRFLFLFFAEDRNLLPPNSVRIILDDWLKLQELDEHIPLYNRFKKYFEYLNTGFKGKKYDVFAYNGGLFKPDEVLDNIVMDDALLFTHTKKLSEYDFESEVDVNILGHIFENSLNELDEIKAQLEGHEIDKSKTKRKKDGVFYTPKYITKYIVENTIGKLCIEKKEELKIVEAEFVSTREHAPLQSSSNHTPLPKKKKQELLTKLTDYRNWLLQLTICDPACGSGAFLNQALDFLISEHKYVDELQAKLFGDAMVLSDVEKSILENNLFGVDLNEESVEIAKLSLWLRTAQPNRKLNDLNNNIKCGNSLIDDPSIAGEKAFNWQTAFPQVFEKKEKTPYHITTAIHDSRTSERMITYHVREKRANGTLPEPQVIPLTDEEETLITNTVVEIIKEDNLNVMAYNICRDHMHLLLVCEENERDRIVQKIKAKTARAVNILRGVTIPSSNTTREHAPLSISEEGNHLSLDKKEKTRGEKQNSLWTQKYGCNEIKDEQQLNNTIEYIRNNRIKHGLTDMQQGSMLPWLYQTQKNAFRTEYKGGFDVIIGNPPYGIFISKEEEQHYKINFPLTSYKTNLYVLFIERMQQIFSKGIVHFIIPKSLLFNTYYESIRKHLLETTEINEILTITEKVFEDAEVGGSLLLKYTIKHNPNKKNLIHLTNADKIIQFINKLGIIENQTSQDYFLNIPNCEISITSKNSQTIINKLHNFKKVSDYYTLKNGLNPGNIKQILISKEKLSEKHKPIIWGKDIARYNIVWSNEYINYDQKINEKITLEDIKSKEGMNKQNRIDFALRSPDLFETKKIVVRKTGDSLICSIDKESYYFDTLVHGIYERTTGFKLEYLLAILNSKPATKFYRLLHDIKGKVFAKISLDNLASFPIPSCDLTEKTEFIIKADQMLALNKNLQELSQKFQRSIQRKFEIDELPKKLQDWYLLTYAEFIKELGKKKIKLSLAQEAEWEEYFNQEVSKAQALKQQIDKTDKETDRMVYALYELTDEEIKIVEGV